MADYIQTLCPRHTQIVEDGGIPLRCLLTASSAVQLWAKNLPSCSPLFLFIQEVAQTEANPSTALSF